MTKNETSKYTLKYTLAICWIKGNWSEGYFKTDKELDNETVEREFKMLYVINQVNQQKDKRDPNEIEKDMVHIKIIKVERI
jgi:hypothetical protein